jgi:hypothetical protein
MMLSPPPVRFEACTNEANKVALSEGSWKKCEGAVPFQRREAAEKGSGARTTRRAATRPQPVNAYLCRRSMTRWRPREHADDGLIVPPVSRAARFGRLDIWYPQSRARDCTDDASRSVLRLSPPPDAAASGRGNLQAPRRRLGEKTCNIHCRCCARRRRWCTMPVQRQRGYRPAATLPDTGGEFRGGDPQCAKVQ